MLCIDCFRVKINNNDTIISFSHLGYIASKEFGIDPT